MKKFLSLIMAMMLVFCAACAEEIEMGNFEGIFIEENVPLQIDLDSDGSQEQLLIKLEGVEEEEHLAVYITGADGGVDSYHTFLMYSTALMAGDMNQDGKTEILISGDVYSDDYNTWCLNYDGETGIYPLLFKDAGRDVNTDEYYEYGYGKITAINGNKIILTGSQDVLGTWMASRTFGLQDGKFDLSDDGLWRMVNIMDDPDMLEYFSLTLTKDLTVMLEDGSEDTLAAGERFVVSQSDKTSVVYFETIGGVKGSFKIEPDVEYGWGSLINGVSENDYFEYVPYAD